MIGTEMEYSQKEDMVKMEHSHKHETEHHPHDMEHHLMSLSEITEHLHKHFKDEIDDANKYQDMANSAGRMNHWELADALHEIAKEEFSHAYFIHCFLKESGVNLSEEVHEEWEELENRFHNILCTENSQLG